MTTNEFSTQDGKFTVATFHMQKGERGASPHEHGYAHDAFVAQGVVKFYLGTIEKTLEAPSTVHFPPNCSHWFEGITDSLVICTHETSLIPK